MTWGCFEVHFEIISLVDDVKYFQIGPCLGHFTEVIFEFSRRYNFDYFAGLSLGFQNECHYPCELNTHVLLGSDYFIT